MSDRIRKSWKVIRSIESADGYYCVDFYVREDGSYGFEEFRRDTEDMGKWTSIAYHSNSKFDNFESALTRANMWVSWIDERSD